MRFFCIAATHFVPNYAALFQVSDTEIFFNDKEFLFTSKPYFLRLFLPCEVTEVADECATYDSDAGTFKVSVPKKNVGEFFPRLAMITELLTPKGLDRVKDPVSELCDDQEVYGYQHLPSEESFTGDGYGFANRRVSVLSHLRDEITLLFDFPDPDSHSNEERKRMLTEKETEKFSDEHYLFDFFNDEIQTFLDFETPWSSGCGQGDDVTFSMDECDRMKNLPKRRIRLNKAETSVVVRSLVDIMFAYVYDFVTTLGEHSVESGWTIRSLCATFSGLVSWNSVHEAVLSAIRRSICYPLYRNLKLSTFVFKNVVNIFNAGN
ncbi:unnamed protein product [Soboliphyme baturini]|uniref:Protein SHQ1 homolog n=1 Tax=Soboliphyme baturini TaxID=241478 RepID=A0A183J0G7_9BILA|nr:unnamed protein product [Soboliphyme baturini]